MRRREEAMKKAQLALLGLVGGLALALGVTARAQVVTGGTPPSLKADVVKNSKQREPIVEAIFKALGPAMRAQLAAGRQVELPGVGIFRIVRVSEYRDLVGGRPATIPARNYVEFLPAAELTAAANAPGVVPAKDVQGYEFRVNPNAASGQKTENRRVPGTRTR
jgi:nucleoid DNA-binding protein